MSTKELILFEKESMTMKRKFYYLMDLLIAHQATSRLESMLFMGIFYLQIIVGFFSEQIGVFDIEESTSDKILNYIQKVIRLKDLFKDNFSGFQAAIFVIFGVLVILTIYFLVVCSKTEKNSFYTCNELVLNFSIKIFIYIGFNMILDMTLSTICFEKGKPHPYFKNESCRIADHFPVFLVSIIVLIFSIFFDFFIQFFYCDSLYLSTSFYAKISCNYEIYMNIGCICYSIFLVYAKYLSREVFLIYNVVVSLVFLSFYLKRYLFYDAYTNILAGLFHLLYAWTSIFFLVFAYIDFQEKGIIYVISSGIVLYFYFNLKSKVEENILLNTPYFKISNKYHLLYYIKNLIDKMNVFEENPKEKVLLTGIMQMHCIECPNPMCLSKTKKKIYLPMTNEWSDRSKPMIHDKVFLINFVIVIMNYFISQSYYSPEMIINISLYYLQIIGNFCQALYFYKKVKEMNLTFQEYFSLIRLEIAISKALIEKFKEPNEPCFNLEDLNVTMYFKYEDLSQHFFDEMGNDVNFSLEFWKSFRSIQIDSSKTIDFNKIFHLTDKIRITKTKVEKIWGKLIAIFNGVNDLFDLYLDYVEQINDDDNLKRELDSIKRKNENSTDHIQQNFYSILFNKETGIIIANGDKGKEGLIEKVNNEIETIFKYKPEELRGMNLSSLMPKMFEQHHKGFMERYFDVGEKRVIDNKDLKTFGKDKDDSIVMIKLAIKLFPMLNESVYFIGLIMKENIDDIIFIDDHFNIQGMSMKLIKILQIENKMLFQENDIPFYVICKKFVNFYKIFLSGKGRNKKEKSRKNSSVIIEESSGLDDIQLEMSDKEEEENDKESEFQENIEINENIELEYEIRLPQFLIDYSHTTAKKEEKQEIKVIKELTRNSDVSNSVHENLKDKEPFEEFGESDLLVDENGNDPRVEEIKEEKFETPDEPTKGEIYDLEKESEGRKLEFNKQSDEEKEFKTKLNEYKKLFEKGDFSQLENLIDKYTSDSSMSDFKFNFTFDRYKYGDKQTAYIVRCIDNKNEGGKSDTESNGEQNDPMALQYRKEKNEALKELIELVASEKQQMLEAPDSFIPLSCNDKEFQKVLAKSKESILDMSRIHGRKKEEVIDDENSSQSSQTGYNADLCKKNRIEEIRANLLKNVSNFYTLRYIKILVLSAALVSVAFCVIYLFFFEWVHEDMKTVSQLNINIFQTTIWTSNLLSTLISLRELYRFEKNNTYTGLEMDMFISGKETYFNSMKEFSFQWYNNIITNFGDVEDKIGVYIKNKESIFWGFEPVSYDQVTLKDIEGFPLAFSQVMSSVNSLLKNEYFTLTGTQDSDKVLQYLQYVVFLSIENSYDNLLPSQFSKIKAVPLIFKDYNKKSIHILLYAVLIYVSAMIIMTVIYGIFLYITNKNMGEGLEKVTKIKIEKIEETIRRIEGFNILLRKFRDKEAFKLNNLFNEENKTTENLTDTAKKNTTGSTTNAGLTSSGFQSDFKKHKKLKILSYSYFQIIILYGIMCCFLIPMYLMTNSIVKSTNKLLDVQSYLFGKLISASASTVKVKCMIGQCALESTLEYDSLVNKSEIQAVVQGISIFKELNDFYNNKFLLNACDTAFDESVDPEKHSECLEDVLVQSANNTDSLLKLIDETVDNLYKDEEMKSGKIFEYPNGTQLEFIPELLFNTNSFKELETVFYKYITPVSDNFASVFQSSLEKYLDNHQIITIILICAFGVISFGICIYIGIFFVNKLIHLLSVSRCILKIIPTIVINSTQELEDWIENKY